LGASRVLITKTSVAPQIRLAPVAERECPNLRPSRA